MTTPPRMAAAVLLTGALLVGVFVLPYWFPPTSAMLSASLLAGFNNALAYDLYVAGLGLLAVVVASFIVRPQVLSGLNADRPLFGVPPWPVLVVMAAHLALFVGLYLWKHAFVFAEALYFEDAAYRVVAGQLPFIDFNFFYGPLLIFPTAVLGKYIGVLQGYAVYYVVSYLVGLYLLYTVVNSLIAERRRAVAWFVLFAVGFFNPITGLNYTFARFLIPMVALLAVWRSHAAFSIGRWSAAVVATALAMLCSPDIAVVTVAAVGVFIASKILQAWQSGELPSVAPTLGIPAVALAVAVAGLLLLDGTWNPVLAYVRPIATFSGGGWSTPIDPSLPMLAVVGMTAVVLAGLAATWLRPANRDMGPIAAALAVMSILLQRAIFGKADVEHIAYSGLPIFLFAAAWGAAVASRKIVAAVIVVLAVGIVLPLQYYHAMLFVPSLMNRFTAFAETPVATTAKPNASKADVQVSLKRAVNHFGRDRLYYMHKLEYYRLPVYLEYGLKPFLFHPSLTSAFTKEDIEGVIGELKTGAPIVLARRADLDVSSSPPPVPRRWLYYATSSPLPGSLVFDLTLEFQARLEKPLIEFLTTSYDAEFDDGDIVGLRLRGDAAAPAHAVQ